MIFYLLDLLINNLNIYISSLILINLDNYEKNDIFYLLLIDILINKIPIIFLSILILKLLNNYLRKVLTKSFFVNNIIYILNYLIFMTVIFVFRADYFIFSNLILFYLKSFAINYFLFLLLRKDNSI